MNSATIVLAYRGRICMQLNLVYRFYNAWERSQFKKEKLRLAKLQELAGLATHFLKTASILR